MDLTRPRKTAAVMKENDHIGMIATPKPRGPSCPTAIAATAADETMRKSTRPTIWYALFEYSTENFNTLGSSEREESE